MIVAIIIISIITTTFTLFFSSGYHNHLKINNCRLITALVAVGEGDRMIEIFHVLKLKQIYIRDDSLAVVMKAASKCGDILKYEKALKDVKDIIDGRKSVGCEIPPFVEEGSAVEDVVVEKGGEVISEGTSDVDKAVV